jgi:hypothetical protein
VALQRDLKYFRSLVEEVRSLCPCHHATQLFRAKFSALSERSTSCLLTLPVGGCVPGSAVLQMKEQKKRDCILCLEQVRQANHRLSLSDWCVLFTGRSDFGDALRAPLLPAVPGPVAQDQLILPGLPQTRLPWCASFCAYVLCSLQQV